MRGERRRALHPAYFFNQWPHESGGYGCLSSNHSNEAAPVGRSLVINMTSNAFCSRSAFPFLTHSCGGSSTLYQRCASMLCLRLSTREACSGR
jgi:hypothetical protein